MSVLVAVEGIDHTGKTTLTAALTEYLRSRGVVVARHVEPGRGPLGQFFRATSQAAEPVAPRALALLSTAARHAEQTHVQRLLHTHQIVVSDRYYLSGLAYHTADGIPGRDYQAWNHGIIRPDVYLLLHAHAATRARRAGEKPDGYWESPQIADHLPSAYAAGVELIRASEDAHVLPVDAEPTPEVVLEQALSALAPLLEGIAP